MSTLPEDPAQAPSTDATPEGAASTTPDTTTAAQPAAAANTPVDTAQTAAQLAERFPALFKGAPKPLKLRIQADIQERAPGVFSKTQLSAFLRRHTGATSYLIAVTKAAHRFDLDGQPAGELTDEHRQVANDELARRRAKRQAQADAQHQAEREAQQARRQRGQLLWDYTHTKLTAANFCALKGIPADQLDALLAQARQEAEEDAKAPRPAGGPGRRDERGPRGDRGDRRDGAHRGPGGDRRGRGEQGARGERNGEGRGDRGPRGDGRGEGRGPRDGQRDGQRKPGQGPRRQDGQGAPRQGKGGGQRPPRDAKPAQADAAAPAAPAAATPAEPPKQD